MAESLEEDHRAAANEFRDAMRALDDGSAGHDGMVGGEGEAVLRALARERDVSRALQAPPALSTGMRNDAPATAVAQRQAFRLAEIALEESAFVIMRARSRARGAGVDGETDASGGSSYFSDMLSAGDGAMWTRACAPTSESLRHLSLSGWRSAECDAAAREMFASGAAFDASDPETALRVVAALQRTRRVVGAHRRDSRRVRRRPREPRAIVRVTSPRRRTVRRIRRSRRRALPALQARRADAPRRVGYRGV